MGRQLKLEALPAIVALTGAPDPEALADLLLAIDAKLREKRAA